MPELYAALTDLIAPDAGAAAELPRLPLAERLISRADRHAAPADWRRWALGLAGLEAAPGDLPVARAVAAAHGVATEADESWFVATPVHLVAGLTRVRFDARGPVSLAPPDLHALLDRFAADWGDASVALVAAGPMLLLRHRPALAVETEDPAAYAGCELAEARPRGPDAGRLERLLTELQMWLHSVKAPSVEGEAVNALWLWGGGRARLVGAARWPTLGGGDPYLAALAAAAPGERSRARLESWSLAALLRDGVGLAATEQRWFAPLAAALRDGSVERAVIHVRGRQFVLRPWQRLRAWVRPRPWWELLA